MTLKNVQLVDVAAKAGVAKSTVGAALRPGGGGKNARVSKQTADRIRRIADEMGYRPNRLASGLRGASTACVAALWQFVDPWCLDANIGNELLRRFQENGLATLQAEHPNDAKRTLHVLTDLLQRRPDALIIRWRPDLMEHARIHRIIQQFKAVVAVVPWAMQSIAIDQVIHDRGSGIREALEHFATTGRRRIAIILNMHDLSDQRKYELFKNHCDHLGLDPDAQQLIDLNIDIPNPDNRVERYTQAMETHFTGPDRTDAILAVNDLGAMTVAKCLRERSIDIGGEVALVGLNDPPQMALWDPPLASIDRNQQALLDTVYNLVTQRINQPELAVQQHTVPMHLVWRESAGPSQ